MSILNFTDGSIRKPISNDCQLMFEKEFPAFSAAEAHGKIAAQYIATIFGSNAEALHSEIIPYRGVVRPAFSERPR